MDYGIFNMRTDIKCMQLRLGCTDNVRESALKADSGRKIPCHTRESNLRWRCASPTLYHLRYIPTPGLRENEMLILNKTKDQIHTAT